VAAVARHASLRIRVIRFVASFNLTACVIFNTVYRNMSYREDLPKGCPPTDAQDITSDFHVIRLTQSLPPTDSDFISKRAEMPDATFRVDECQARGLSVFTEQKDAINALKLPALRGRHACKLRLKSGAGKIKQTGRPSHHTWWPLKDFDILAHCIGATV
jgi:hypothetical protein